MEKIVNAIDNLAVPNYAEIITAIAAIIALIVNIIIAIKQQKIANNQNEITKAQAQILREQNNIALFEKRFAVYSELQKCIIFDNGIRNASTLSDVLSYFSAAFCDGVKLIVKPEDFQMITLEYRKTVNILSQEKFVFSFDFETQIDKLEAALICLLTTLDNDSTKVIAARDIYHSIVKDFKNDIIPQIEAVLKI